MNEHPMMLVLRAIRGEDCKGGTFRLGFAPHFIDPLNADRITWASNDDNECG
jgi:hypothetical protein